METPTHSLPAVAIMQLLGQAVQVQLTERQVIGIRLQEDNPWQQ